MTNVHLFMPTPTRVSALLCVTALASLSACALDAAPGQVNATGVAISVAPLTLSGVTNARYQLEIFNGSGEVVTDLTLSADQYGDGAGSLSYVAPCDAADNDNRVRLTLLDLYEGTSDTLIPPATYTNPGPLERTITCLPDADVSVAFDLTIARDASQGFFDIAVELDQIFCSAKLDCLSDVNDANSTLSLLFNNGQRDTTFVLGFACTGGLGDVETWQYLDDVNVTCGGDSVLVDVSAGLGNLPASAFTQVSGTHNPLFGAAVFQGQEQLPTYDKQYWNVALGFEQGASCRVTTTGTASNGELAGHATPNGTTWPLVTWDVNLTDGAGAITCSQHPVNAATCPASGVCVGYTDAATPESFDSAFSYGPGCVSGDGQCPTGCYVTSDTDCTLDCRDDATWPPLWAQWESEVIYWTNAYRTGAEPAPGVTIQDCGAEGNFTVTTALTYDSRLREAARCHSLDMAVNNFFSHTGSDGSTVPDRAVAAGYTPWQALAENIAAGQTSPQDAVAAWMASDPHCADIMNASVTDIGAGYMFLTGSTYTHYWTEDFGKLQ